MGTDIQYLTVYIFYARNLIFYQSKVLFNYLLFSVQSFAFFLVECQNEKHGVVRERYFRMVSNADFIGSYFY